MNVDNHKGLFVPLAAMVIICCASLYAARLVPNSPFNSSELRLAIVLVGTLMFASGLLSAGRLSMIEIGRVLAGGCLGLAVIVGMAWNAYRLPIALAGERQYTNYFQPGLDLASITSAAPRAREHSDRAFYLTMADYYRGCEIQLPANSIISASKLRFWAQIYAIQTNVEITPIATPAEGALESFGVADNGLVYFPAGFRHELVPEGCIVTAHPVSESPETRLVLRVSVGMQ
jgi:hypothetical protein